MMSVARRIAIGSISVAALLALWWAATGLGWVAPIFLPSPSAVLKEGATVFAGGHLAVDVWASSRRVFTGFALAAAVAIPLGIVMGVWVPAKAAMDPFVSLLRPLPSITWIPLTMLWLGIGEQQKVAIVFMGSWIYILLSTVEATKRVDPVLIRAARNLGANDLAVMREVVLPGALPGILTGLKVTLAISWSCVLSAEMIANWLVRYADGQLVRQPTGEEMNRDIEMMLKWRRQERPAAQVIWIITRSAE